MANLIEYIQSQVYENSTEDISGSIMQQVLTRMASDEGVVNVHTISGQTPFADYNNAQAARDAVPAGFKKLGLIITYKLSSGWYIDEFIGSATSGWSTASNWKCLGPISVSQNASTGKTTITIGSESFDVATQPVSVSQNSLTEHTDITIGSTTTPVASVNEINTITGTNESDITNAKSYIRNCYLIPQTDAKLAYLQSLSPNTIHLYYWAVRNSNLGTNAIFGLMLKIGDSNYATFYTTEVPNLLKNTIIELPTTWTVAGELGSGFKCYVEFNQNVDLSTATSLQSSGNVFVNVLNRTQIAFLMQSIKAKDEIDSLSTELSNKDDYPTITSQRLVKSGGVFDKFSDIVVPLSLNLFNKNDADVVSGYIADDGTITTHSSYKTSGFIKVECGKLYRCSNNYNFMVCLYDVWGNFVKYYVNSNSFNTTSENQIPEGTAYARFSMRNEDLDNAYFCNQQEYYNRNAWELLTTYKEGIVADQLKGQLIEQTKAVSTMEGLLTWLGCVIDTEKYHYTICLAEGTYTLTSAMIDSLQTQQYGRIGILLPNNVDLVGLGSGAKIVCDLTGEEEGYQQYISPLNIKWNNRLKNLTIEITNGRYAVHADNSNGVQNVKWEIENCTFIHHGNSDGEWSYPYAWGEGGCSGHHAVFRNCTFIAPTGAYYAHNNTNFDLPMYHLFDGCKFVSTNKGCAVMLQSLGSGTKDVMEFNGCSFEGILDSRAGSAAGSGVTACDFVVIGSGNSPLCENWYYADGVNYHSNFGDEVIPFVNNNEVAIIAGTFMRYDADMLKPMVSGDNVISFVGVCLDNVPVGGIGYIKVKGAYRVTAPADVVWATLGTKIKIGTYNSFAVADNINVVGRMYYRNTAFQRYYMLLE